jgi:hypothetical protein
MRHLLIFLLLSLGACSPSDSRLPAVPEGTEYAQVGNWRGGSAAVAARFYGSGGAAEVASGTVNAAGGLEFTLKPVEAAQLTGFSACAGVAVSDPALRLNSFSALAVLDGAGVQRGRVALASSAAVVSEGLEQVGNYYLQYTYADRAAQIRGSCAVGGAPGTFSYALELRPGWNGVVFRLTGDGVLRLSTEAVPAGAAWFLGEDVQ